MLRTERIPKHLTAAVLAVILASTSSAFSQTAYPVPADGGAGQQLNMLVLGDSILWGQGLSTENKAWYQVKTWLQKNTGRVVSEKIEAHSGAVIESAGAAPADSVIADGEVNLATPTVKDEMEHALKSYSDGSKVDLVLVNGCINDVDVLNLLNAATPVDEIRRLTAAKCGPPMERLLGRITSLFPSANVILTGYFPIMSEKTPNNLPMRALGRSFYKATPESPQISDKQLRAALIAISNEWYQVSNQSLAEAARKANADLVTRGSRQRVLFAEIPFSPTYSFSAPETHLWGLDTPLVRKLLFLLSFGKVGFPTNDERRKQRIASCNEVYKQLAGDNADQKKAIERRRLLCQYAALGHPNRKGSLLYADAITSQLKSLMSETGWMRAEGAGAAGPVH